MSYDRHDVRVDDLDRAMRPQTPWQASWGDHRGIGATMADALEDLASSIRQGGEPASSAATAQRDPVALQCDMASECDRPVTHLDRKGFIYCEDHGLARRLWKPCRKLRPHELNRLRRGLQITRY